MHQFDMTGRLWLRGAIDHDALKNLCELGDVDTRPGKRISERTALFDHVATASFSDRIKSLWPGMRPVRLVSFDKNGDANWTVPWHQDRVIAVREKVDLPGYTNWSQKGGTWHCEPPIKMLQQMLFVRVHLDNSTAQNGAMEIAVGSHAAGKVPADAAASTAAHYPVEMTTAAAGDVLVLSMLTLHRSLPADVASNRRVLRIDYAPFDLPEPLRWAA